MKKYCVGFVFDKSMENVLLIRKIGGPFPGKLNGVGGHIEGDENPFIAMGRELKEETGIELMENEFIKLITKQTFFIDTNSNFPVVELHVFYIRLNDNNGIKVDCYQRFDKEGYVKFYHIKTEDLLNAANNNLAGEGNIPYFIELSRQMEGYYV